MRRITLFGATLLCLQVATASAQQWADKMFSERSHDFGPVARAAKVEYEFPIKNIYGEDVHIASVRSSCGCTQPRVAKDTLKPNEQGGIICAFNTRAFTGQRSAHVTVTIDRPRYAEVHLDVRGYIRTDVVVDPNQVAFGSVDQGTAADRKVHIEYSGRNDWKIADVKSNSPFVTATVKETGRGNGRVGYDLFVHLDDKVPAGYLRDLLTLTTNDGWAKSFTVNVEGRVVSDLTVSPSSLMLGTIQPGQVVTKQIIVRGKKPFRILNVHSNDAGFAFQPNDEAKEMHVIPVTFTAGDKPMKIQGKIVIETDVEGHPVAELSVFGQIAAPLAGT